MSKKKILELVLETSGFKMEKFELIRNGSCTGYEFEAHKDGVFQFQVATDSFELALSDTLQGIYETEDVSFGGVL
jgi:hypothetical protein